MMNMTREPRIPACGTCASKKVVGFLDKHYFCKAHRPHVSNEILAEVIKLLTIIAPKCMRTTCKDYAFYRITSDIESSGKAQRERLACDLHKMTNEHESIKELVHTPSLRSILKHLNVEA